MNESITVEDIEKQLALLEDSDPRTRMRAIGSLRRSDDLRTIEPLCERLLRDEVPDVRARAAGALGQIGESSAIEALSQALLQDKAAEVRRRAVQALNQIGASHTTEPLIRALSDSDRDVRRLAARTLGEIGDPSTLDALKRVRNDPNVVVQEEAVQAIRAIQDRQSLQVQRDKVEQLKEKRNRTTGDTIDQVRLDSEIDMEQLSIYRLEASLAASKVALPVDGDETELDQERQTVVNELERLTRELESMSTSVRAVRLREVWENQLTEAENLRTAWNSNGDLSLDDMRTELRRLKQRKEERFDNQNKELIELTRFIQEGYSNRLQIEQISDTLSDPTNRIMSKNWCHEAEAAYNLLKIAREQGGMLKQKNSF